VGSLHGKISALSLHWCRRRMRWHTEGPTPCCFWPNPNTKIPNSPLASLQEGSRKEPILIFY